MKTLFNNKGAALIILIIAMNLISVLGASMVSIMGAKQSPYPLPYGCVPQGAGAYYDEVGHVL